MEPRNLLAHLLEMAFLFVVTAWLLKTGVRILMEIWPALAVIAAVFLGIAILWRIWKHMRDIGKW